MVTSGSRASSPISLQSMHRSAQNFAMSTPQRAARSLTVSITIFSDGSPRSHQYSVSNTSRFSPTVAQTTWRACPSMTREKRWLRAITCSSASHHNFPSRSAKPVAT